MSVIIVLHGSTASLSSLLAAGVFSVTQVLNTGFLLLQPNYSCACVCMHLSPLFDLLVRVNGRLVCLLFKYGWLHFVIHGSFPCTHSFVPFVPRPICTWLFCLPTFDQLESPRDLSSYLERIIVTCDSLLALLLLISDHGSAQIFCTACPSVLSWLVVFTEMFTHSFMDVSVWCANELSVWCLLWGG